MGFSFLLLVPVLVFEHIRKRKEGGASRPSLKDLALCGLSGVFLAVHFATWIQSLSMTSIASSVVLVDTHPLFVLAAGFLLYRERVSRRALLFVAVAFVGIVILSYSDFRRGTDTFSGDLLALAGAGAVAGYILIGRSVRQRMGAVQYAALVYLSSTVTLVLICGVWSVPVRGFPGREFLIFLGMAFFCTILGHTLFNWALKYLKASVVSTTVLTEPVYATVLGIIIFREMPHVLVLIGGVVILAGVLLFVREEGKIQK